MNSNPSSAPASAPLEIVRNSVVRILYGPHANQYATVIAVGACGHKAHDPVSLDLHSSLDENVVFLPRWALELVPPQPVRPKGIQRICRFKVGDKVRITAPALEGRIVEVFNEPVVPDFTGRTEGPFHARYLVSVVHSYAGFARHTSQTRYDCELQPVES